MSKCWYYPDSHIEVRSAFAAVLLVALLACSSKPQAPAALAPAATLDTTEAGAAQRRAALELPHDFGHYTGDWDVIAKRGVLRVLVIYSRIGFFYDRGRPRGIHVDAMQEFENSINKKQRNGVRKFKVAFIPTTPGQLLQELNDGLGDLICSGIIVTPEREKLVDFTIPYADGVELVPVTPKDAAPVHDIEELSGKSVFVNPASVAKTELEQLNVRLKQAGRPEVNIVVYDPNLTEDDLIEMVNAGLIPATIALDYRARALSQVYDNITLNPAVLNKSGNLAWAMRKGSPQLKAVMDEFIKTHRVGTTFGNMMVRRYVTNAEHLKNSTSEAEMKKFRAYVKYFQQYATQYNFDYLMLGALGYQESMLDQNRVSPRGAVGVMQVIPRYAAASPINIPNVHDARNNIHAGTKMLAQITNTYFDDPGLDQMNKTLFTFAAYNAGAPRIVQLRKEARQEGLDPNEWFGNVELVVAQDIGQETVQYVANIYKYYVAYKLALEQRQIREQAKQKMKGN